MAQVNVKDYGAAGNGLTNDQAAFNLALSAAGPGGTVKVPNTTNPTVYIIDGLALDGGQRLIGDGRDGTTLRASITGRGAAISRAANLSPLFPLQGAKVCEICLDGFEFGIDARGVYESVFEDVLITRAQIAIFLGRRNGEVNGTIWNQFRKIKTVGSAIRDFDTDVSTNDPPINLNQFQHCQFESQANAPQLVGLGGNGLVANGFSGNEFKGGIRLVSTLSTSFYGNYFEGAHSATAQIELDVSNVGVPIIGNYFNNWGAIAAIRIGYGGGNGSSAESVLIASNSFFSGFVAVLVPANANSVSDIRMLPNKFSGVSNPVIDPLGKITHL